jgi:hypothetical protein
MKKVYSEPGFTVERWARLARRKAALAAKEGIEVTWRATLTDEESLREIEELLRPFPARVDFPSSFFFREQIALAEARGEDYIVVHSVRDADSWVKSVSETIYARVEAASQEPLMALFQLTGAITVAFGYPLAAHADFMHRLDMMVPVFGGSFLPGRSIAEMSLQNPENRAEVARRFDEHTEWVKSVVPADRLIIFHPRDGWAPLCTALGVPAPAEPFPRVNSSSDFNKVNRKMRTAPYASVVFTFLLLLLLFSVGLVRGGIAILVLYCTNALIRQHYTIGME